MQSSAAAPRLSVQTKVLIPVTVLLVLLPVAVIWIVNDTITRQVREEAVTALTTADGVFRHLLENQGRDLLEHYNSALGERGTMQRTYQDLLKIAANQSPAAVHTLRDALAQQLGGDTVAILLASDGATAPVGARSDDSLFAADAFTRAALPLSRAALAGESGSAWIALDGTVLNTVAVPVVVNNQVAGALTVGVRVSEATVQEFKQLTGTEIVLLAGDRVAASTVSGVDLAGLGGGASRPGEAQQRVLKGEHFLATAGAYGEVAGVGGFRYVLLSSYEQSRRTLAEMQRTLVAVSAAGILLSAGAVWFFVRRIIHPLRQLRDTAEAVGHGDFSRRMGRLANDELGDLAEAFNRMTSNLQTSRTELERAVETLQATQAQLIQSEKLSAVGQFVAGVAHELNNPLTAVIGFSDLLVQTPTDPAIKPHLERIARSAHRCHKIVQNLLGFARQHPPERALVAVNDAIDEVLEIMAYDFRTGNVEIVREFGGDLPLILADRHQLQQVFINILSNGRQAIQAFSNQGRITLRTRRVDADVQVELADNGPGISAENLSRIFDPFFTTKPVGKGTGLGLSLCYGIVREHGGTISARSEPGQGASFLITVPAASAAAGASEARTEPAARRADGTGRSVLVVDDEEEILALTRELLRQDGYTVETVAGGEAAVAAIARTRFDVIVSDWKMPGMNGLQLYEHLLATHPAAAARVCFMSGDVVSDAFQEFLRRQARVCLPKPFSIKDFQNAVAGLLELGMAT